MKLLNNSLFRIAAPPMALLIIHVIVTKTGLYDKFWWFDIPMHFLGGILVALAIVVLLDFFTKEKMLIINSLTLKVLIIIAITALFAVSWEVIEFLLDIYFNTGLQAGLSDTMKDICMGIIGANVVTTTLYIKSKLKN